MDPNETLRRLRALCAADIGPWKARGHWDEVEELRELFHALDEWLSGGGYIPDGWARDTRRPIVPRDGQHPHLRLNGPYTPEQVVAREPLGGPIPGVNGAHLPEDDHG